MPFFYLAGYKGYGLAMLVEIFCGILGNSAFGPNIRQWKKTDGVANLVLPHLLVNSLPPGKYFPTFCRRLIFFKINFFEKFFQEYDHSVKQFGSGSGLTECRA